jgi:hypothetical protein
MSIPVDKGKVFSLTVIDRAASLAAQTPDGLSRSLGWGHLYVGSANPRRRNANEFRKS